VPIPIVYDGIEFEEGYRAKGMGLKIVGDAADSVLQVQAPSFACLCVPLREAQKNATVR